MTNQPEPSQQPNDAKPAGIPKATLEAYGVYAALGDDAAGVFARLVSRFYDGVEADLVLRPLYPDDDMHGARERLTLFLIQYFGGPAAYAEARGHPRLRMRHAPFAIGTRERDAWLSHVHTALDLTPELAPFAPLMRAYFENAANFMMNRPV